MYHDDSDIRQAQIKLCDALCEWERATGRESLLVLFEPEGYGFVAVSGKPLPPGEGSNHESILAYIRKLLGA